MPEKLLNEIPRPLREQYEKGLAAMQRGNLDYAIALFEKVLATDPAFYDCREALRATQFKRAGVQSGFFKRFIGNASNSPFIAKGQIALRNDPIEAIKVAEQILNTDPHSAAAHRLLADGALAAGLPKTAALSLEIVYKNLPGDKEVGLKLGQAFALSGQIPRAESVLAELFRSHPLDSEIAMALKNISANRTMSEGGYEKLGEGKGSYRDILRDEKQSVALEQEKRDVKTEDLAAQLIPEYEQRLAAEPRSLRVLRTLAELYAQKKDFDRSLEYYRRIVEADGANDSTIEKAIADTTARRYDYLISQLDPHSADYESQVAKLEADKRAFQLDECRRRADRYPNDLQIRFDLGQLYFHAGKIPEAIQEFQRAQVNPHRRIASLAYLGQCFTRRGMHDLAARTFQAALKEKLVFDEEKKDLLYLLGSSFEAVGKTAEAIEQFKAIYENDISYRDVAAKVDAYYAAQ